MESMESPRCGCSQQVSGANVSKRVHIELERLQMRLFTVSRLHAMVVPTTPSHERLRAWAAEAARDRRMDAFGEFEHGGVFGWDRGGARD
jgi:hypothetical protein